MKSKSNKEKIEKNVALQKDYDNAFKRMERSRLVSTLSSNNYVQPQESNEGQLQKNMQVFTNLINQITNLVGSEGKQLTANDVSYILDRIIQIRDFYMTFLQNTDISNEASQILSNFAEHISTVNPELAKKIAMVLSGAKEMADEKANFNDNIQQLKKTGTTLLEEKKKDILQDKQIEALNLLNNKQDTIIGYNRAIRNAVLRQRQSDKVAELPEGYTDDRSLMPTPQKDNTVTPARNTKGPIRQPDFDDDAGEIEAVQDQIIQSHVGELMQKLDELGHGQTPLKDLAKIPTKEIEATFNNTDRKRLVALMNTGLGDITPEKIPEMLDKPSIFQSFKQTTMAMFSQAPRSAAVAYSADNSPSFRSMVSDNNDDDEEEEKPPVVKEEDPGQVQVSDSLRKTGKLLNNLRLANSELDGVYISLNDKNYKDRSKLQAQVDRLKTEYSTQEFADNNIKGKDEAITAAYARLLKRLHTFDDAFKKTTVTLKSDADLKSYLPVTPDVVAKYENKTPINKLTYAENVLRAHELNSHLLTPEVKRSVEKLRDEGVEKITAPILEQDSSESKALNSTLAEQQHSVEKEIEAADESFNIEKDIASMLKAELDLNEKVVDLDGATKKMVEALETNQDGMPGDMFEKYKTPILLVPNTTKRLLSKADLGKLRLIEPSKTGKMELTKKDIDRAIAENTFASLSDSKDRAEHAATIKKLTDEFFDSKTTEARKNTIEKELLYKYYARIYKGKGTAKGSGGSLQGGMIPDNAALRGQFMITTTEKINAILKYTKKMADQLKVQDARIAAVVNHPPWEARGRNMIALATELLAFTTKLIGVIFVLLQVWENYEVITGSFDEAKDMAVFVVNGVRTGLPLLATLEVIKQLRRYEGELKLLMTGIRKVANLSVSAYRAISPVVLKTASAARRAIRSLTPTNIAARIREVSSDPDDIEEREGSLSKKLESHYGDDGDDAKEEEEEEPRTVPRRGRGRPKKGGNFLDQTGFVKNAKKTLDEYGNDQILNVTICRQKIPSIVNALYTKVLPYDKLYHLSALVTVSHNGQQKLIKVEKQSFVTVTTAISLPSDTESLNVPGPFPQGTSLNSVFARMRQSMGSRFFTYDAFKNNCQTFLLALLHSMNKKNPQIDTFIWQHKIQDVKVNNVVHGFTNAVTGLHGQIMGNLLGGKEAIDFD